LLDFVTCAIAFGKEIKLVRIDGDKEEKMYSASMIIQYNDENITACLGCCLLYKSGNNCIYILVILVSIQEILSFYKLLFGYQGCLSFGW
jgi:hypothetical protein